MAFNSLIIKNVFAKRVDESIHTLLYFYCLCLLVISLPTSIYMVSVSQILMGGNWLLEGHYREKINRFFRNKPALFLVSIYIVFIVGMIWTRDLSHGFGKELLDKLPFLTLTFVVASSRLLSKDRLYALLLMFCAAILLSSFIGFLIFLKGDYVDSRDISPFLMHVYMSLMVVMTIFLLPWVIKQVTSNRKWWYISLLASFSLLLFLIILGSVTGIISLVGVMIFIGIREVIMGQVLLRKVVVGVMALIALTGVILIYLYVISPLLSVIEPDPTALTQKTASGNPYMHYFEEDQRENGHRVYFFIAEEEARNAWNKVSLIDFSGYDRKMNEIRITIYRYLSSKGLRKDKESIESLQEEEIQAIEMGVPNYLYLKWPNAIVRIHQTFWEVYTYRLTGNPLNLSFVQRVELWRVAWTAYKVNPVLGWGTGDIFVAMAYGRSAIDSPIEKPRMKPHNQFLTIMIQLGLIGLVLIFALYILFIKKSKAWRYLPFNIMLVIIFTAFFGTNLLDFQIGITFFLFFSLFYGIMYPGRIQDTGNLTDTKND
jgi:hypothetical protein